MNAYTAGHLALMHGFMILGCLIVLALVVSGLVMAFAWFYDRWCQRGGTRRRQIAPEGFEDRTGFHIGTSAASHTHPHFTRHKKHI